MNGNELNRFLKNLYDLLHKEDIIIKTSSTSKEKLKIVSEYIEKLDRVQSKASERHINYLKELYYEKYLIKENDIPEAYWHKLEKRYLTEGKGYLDLINPCSSLELYLRKINVERIINTQKSSLDAWLDYLLSSKASHLPMWAKIWAFHGMLKIGPLNQNKDRYLNRRKDTIAPFIDIDSFILTKSVEYLKMSFSKNEFDDEEIKRLAMSQSFQNIYGNLLANKKTIKTNGNEGTWIKYNYGSIEDARKLYNDLVKYNTDWCTVYDLGTAIEQLCGSDNYKGGDFYVYFTSDENNEYKVPRLAIRMEGNSIGEIRGIAYKQHVESEMEMILKEKLKEFPDGEEYLKKVSDMEQLTQIYKKCDTDELTITELEFLYEINSEILSFGYQKDPRINEVLKYRNNKKDLARVFDCKYNEVGIRPESINNNDFLVYYGDLNYNDYASVKNINFPKIVIGSLFLSDVISPEGLVLPKKVSKSLYLASLSSAEDLILPFGIGKDLYLNSLKNIDGLIFPSILGGDLNLSGLINALNVEFPIKIAGNLYLNNLRTTENIVLPQEIGGNLYLTKINIEDLVFANLQFVGGKIYLRDGIYTFLELKKLLNLKKEQLGLLNKKEKLESNKNDLGCDFKRGYVSIYLIICLLIILGVITASIIYKFS